MRIYAAAEIPVYWIVTLVERQVEVSAGPSGPRAEADFARREVFVSCQRIPVVLDGSEVGQVAVDDVLP